MAYNLLVPYHLTTAQSLAASYTSPAQEIQNQDNVGIQLDWTGTPTGAFSFQISSDYAQDINGNITNAGRWVTLTVLPAITAAGSADNAYVDFNQLSAPYIRVVYTRSAGTGSLDIFVTAKGV